MHLSLLRKYLSHFSQNIIPRVIQLKKPKSVYSFFLPSLIISHSKYLIFKNTYYIRRKKVSGNMSSPNAKGHPQRSIGSTYLFSRKKCCCENYLSITFLASKYKIIGKYACLSPQTSIPWALSANIYTQVSFLNICNFEIVHWPTIHHTQPSNLTWAWRFWLVRDHSHFFSWKLLKKYCQKYHLKHCRVVFISLHSKSMY